MKPCIEIDFIVEDSIKAAEIYKNVFGADEIEVSSEEKGLNEARFVMFGMRFSILDANDEYEMTGPVKDEPNPMWCNLLVEDIEDIFNKAEKEDFEIIQPMTEIEEFGVITAVVRDPFGYEWALNEILEEDEHECTEGCCTLAEDEME